MDFTEELDFVSALESESFESGKVGARLLAGVLQLIVIVLFKGDKKQTIDNSFVGSEVL